MKTPKLRAVLAILVVLLTCVLAIGQAQPKPALAAAPVLAGCEVFPDDHIWNVPIDTLPVDAHSADYIESIGPDTGIKADFGSGTWDGFPIGIPYVDVPETQAPSTVVFDYAGESDPGPYPIPSNPPIEGDPNGNGDRHILMVDRDNCILYELYAAHKEGDVWHAGSGAVFNLNNYALRPAGWTSADAAGLPILPGLVRYDEVASGEIRHAIRFTANSTQRAYVWPARHFASSNTDPSVPPMGQRFRLKADYVIPSTFSDEVQTILRAMKTYGLILADNGSNWYISGAPNAGWDNDDLRDLRSVAGSNFEAVDVSSLMIDAHSGQALVDGDDPPETVYTISGNAGAGGATLNYVDGTPQTATADSSGLYSFTAPSGWSGTVTPSLAGYTFTPASRSYSNLTSDQTGQDYTASSVAPATPVLLSPANNAPTPDATPTFGWENSSGATQYQIQVDNNSNFSSPEIGEIVTSLAYTPATALADGIYYWHVQAGNTGGWSAYSGSWTVTIDTVPAAPTLLSPGNGSTVNDLTPIFDWADVVGASRYQLQVDDTANFSSPVLNVQRTTSTYTVSSVLSAGIYYWRVRTRNSLNTWGVWGIPWTVTLNGVLPAAPTLLTPADGSTTADLTPTFDWSDVAGASRYRLQVDDTANFSSPVVSLYRTVSTYTVSTSLANGTYYWRVRTQDTMGTWGDWCTSWALVVQAQ